MKNKIRKVIREQIKKLKEYGNLSSPTHRSRARDFSASSPQSSESNQVLVVTSEHGVEVHITDPRDIKDFLAGKGTVYGEDQDGGAVEVNINSALNYQISEGMSPEEWAYAKEAERLDQHPEKDKINKIKQMMDKEADDKEQEEWDKGWYGESLKETASKLGYLLESEFEDFGKEINRPEEDEFADLGEEVDEQGLDQIEMGLNQITGGGRQSAGVSDRGDKIRVMFRYMRGEFDGETWEAILEYLSDNMGYKILDQSNYYEANYDREEPAEAVPMIHLQK